LERAVQSLVHGNPAILISSFQEALHPADTALVERARDARRVRLQPRRDCRALGKDRCRLPPAPLAREAERGGRTPYADALQRRTPAAVGSTASKRATRTSSRKKCRAESSAIAPAPAAARSAP